MGACLLCLSKLRAGYSYGRVVFLHMFSAGGGLRTLDLYPTASARKRLQSPDYELHPVRSGALTRLGYPGRK